MFGDEGFSFCHSVDTNDSYETTNRVFDELRHDRNITHLHNHLHLHRQHQQQTANDSRENTSLFATVSCDLYKSVVTLITT